MNQVELQPFSNSTEKEKSCSWLLLVSMVSRSHSLPSEWGPPLQWHHSVQNRTWLMRGVVLPEVNSFLKVEPSLLHWDLPKPHLVSAGLVQLWVTLNLATPEQSCCRECLAIGAGSQLMTQVLFSTELTLKPAPSHTIPEELRIAGLKK